MTENEKRFRRKMVKAGWYVYNDEKTGRLVTNAYPHELERIEKISGVPCESLGQLFGPGTVDQIGPKP